MVDRHRARGEDQERNICALQQARQDQEQAQIKLLQTQLEEMLGRKAAAENNAEELQRRLAELASKGEELVRQREVLERNLTSAQRAAAEKEDHLRADLTRLEKETDMAKLRANDEAAALKAAELSLAAAEDRVRVLQAQVEELRRVASQQEHETAKERDKERQALVQATRAQAEAEGELAHVKVERDRALQELRVNSEAEGELQQVRSERDRALENLRVNALQEAARESAREQERTTEIERERMRERERELGQKMLLAAQKAQAAAEGELQHLQTERLQPMEALVGQLKSVSIQHQETIRELCKERHALEARLKASEDAAAVLHVKLQTAEEGKAASDAMAAEVAATVAAAEAQAQTALNAQRIENARAVDREKVVEDQRMKLIQKLEQQIDTCQQQFQSLTLDVTKLNKTIFCREEIVREKQELLHAAATTNSALAGELRAVDLQLQDAQRKIERLERERQQENEEMRLMRQRLEENIAAEQERRVENEDMIKRQALAHNVVLEEVSGLQQTTERLQKMLTESEGKVERDEVRMRKLEEDHQQERAQHKDAISKFETTISQGQQALDRVQRQLERETSELQDKRRELEEMSRANQSLQDLAEANSALQAANERKDGQIVRRFHVLLISLTHCQ